jgi:hypothetical protein
MWFYIGLINRENQGKSGWENGHLGVGAQPCDAVQEERQEAAEEEGVTKAGEEGEAQAAFNWRRWASAERVHWQGLR